MLILPDLGHAREHSSESDIDYRFWGNRDKGNGWDDRNLGSGPGDRDMILQDLMPPLFPSRMRLGCYYLSLGPSRSLGATDLLP